jgi:hypothetical protein
MGRALSVVVRRVLGVGVTMQLRALAYDHDTSLVTVAAISGPGEKEGVWLASTRDACAT